jgi:hypothetical protein
VKIISSFSGGRTSAYMTAKLKEKYPDLVVLFANTSQERNETLDFVNRCDTEFNLNVVWLEAKVTHEKGIGTTYLETSFSNAKRNGEVFESIIKKYGIPNKSGPLCTRELKLVPIQKWIKDNINEDYKMAIGIRADESKRVSKDAEKNKLFYPLIETPVYKYEVNEFWKTQDFDLGLFDYQGNCKTCFKKSNKKLIMIAKEHPEYFDFNIEMENRYGVYPDGNKRVFFRENKSAAELLKMACIDQLSIFDWINKIDEDENSGCSESCEAMN